MKKVLIISFFFNEKELVGSLRSRGLAKYLSHFGWKPTVLTHRTQNKTNLNVRIIETDYEDILKIWKNRFGLNTEKTFHEQVKFSDSNNKKSMFNILMNFWLDIFAYPDSQNGWYDYALNEGVKLLEKEQFDLIISTSSPVTSHLIAYELKKQFNIPWVADLRDLWTQNHYYNHSKIRKMIERKLELKTLAEADALVTVSTPFSQKLKKLHKREKVHVIHNGFDPDIKIDKIARSNKFRILYSGSIYRGKQNPKPLFEATNTLLRKKKIDENDFKIEFFGRNIGKDVKENIKKYDLQHIIKCRGVISHDEMLKKQREAQVLLLLNWTDTKRTGVIPAKFFEYLAAKKPILIIGGEKDCSVVRLMEKTNSGKFINNQKELVSFLLSNYNKWKNNGTIPYYGKTSEINKFSHIKMAEKYADILNEICQK